MAQNLLSLLRSVGFKGDALRTAWAIAMRESGGNPRAFNGNTSTGDQSYGLFQINMLGKMGPGRRAQFGLQNNNQLLDAVTNAKVAYRMSKGGTDFGAWGLGPNAYKGAPKAAHDAFVRYYNEFPGAAGRGTPLSSSVQDYSSMFEGNTSGENPQFLSALAQAVQAAGGTKVRMISGFRSPAHNAAVGGVQGSLHTRGLAMDGEMLVNGKWVPLGVGLKGDAGQYGLRSGDQPGFYKGGPDPNHVDFGYGSHPSTGGGLSGGATAAGMGSQPRDLRQHIVNSKVQTLGSALSIQLMANAKELASGTAPTGLKNLFTLAKGFQQARRPAPLGGTAFAQGMGQTGLQPLPFDKAPSLQQTSTQQ